MVDGSENAFIGFSDPENLYFDTSEGGIEDFLTKPDPGYPSPPPGVTLGHGRWI